MIMLLTFAVLFFASAVTVYIYVRRKQTILNPSHRESERRRRAVLDDFGDEAVWQIGQGAATAIASTVPMEIVRTRRGFLARLVSSFFVMIAGSSVRRVAVAQSSGKALAWESGHPERRAWSDELRKAIRAHISSLENASDIQDFAPDYSRLSTQDRVDVWATLIVAMSRFESKYDPTAIYPESFGVDSIGLLQLSYENETYYRLERLDRSARSLEDPLVNIRCGVKILAVLVKRDGVIASGTGSSSRGGARYWSTLRTDGKLSDIQRIVRNFRSRAHGDVPHGDSG